MPNPVEQILVPIRGDHVLIQVPKDRVQEVLSLLEGPPRSASESIEAADPVAGEPADRADARTTDHDEDSSPWTAEELTTLVNDRLQPKQLVLLELLIEHAGERVPASEARDRLEKSGLLKHTSYSGKALGGVVLSLKRRAKWYRESKLFEDIWDPETWMHWYRLRVEHVEPLRAAIAELRGE